ncbi:MAG: hypothetical protein M3N13_03765 [Candidatus Eremiobacteraeota bacterium]|nr:hypothetical protein [Candidatus Eremiobacteraeota bacterium]
MFDAILIVLSVICFAALELYVRCYEGYLRVKPTNPAVSSNEGTMNFHSAQSVFAGTVDAHIVDVLKKLSGSGRICDDRGAEDFFDVPIAASVCVL